jgi:hypothetical protein
MDGGTGRIGKNRGFFQIEPPEGAEPGKPEPAEPVGLPGFSM